MALNFTRVWRREHLQSTNCKVNRKPQNPDLKENVSDSLLEKCKPATLKLNSNSVLLLNYLVRALAQIP